MTKKKTNNDEMSLMGHLDELRHRLTVIVIVNLGAAMLLFNQAKEVMRYLLDINPGMQLVYITPSELLLVYIQLAFIMGFILCSPVTIYQIWAFIQKGLYKKEKTSILLALFFGMAFFVTGVFFCYFFVLPTILQFFVRIEAIEVDAMISVKSYMSFVNSMLLAFGGVFEMPVLVFLLTKLRILKPSFMKKNRGLLTIAVFIAAAIITPPDVVSQLMLAIPMLLLLQLSIFVCIIVDKGNRRREKESDV